MPSAVAGPTALHLLIKVPPITEQYTVSPTPIPVKMCTLENSTKMVCERATGRLRIITEILMKDSGIMTSLMVLGCTAGGTVAGMRASLKWGNRTEKENAYIQLEGST